MDFGEEKVGAGVRDGGFVILGVGRENQRRLGGVKDRSVVGEMFKGGRIVGANEAGGLAAGEGVGAMVLPGPADRINGFALVE